MADAFYPFVENPGEDGDTPMEVVPCAARVAVYDSASAAPRVVVVEPTDIRDYLEQITATVTRLAKEQGGRIPFTVIRECVENLIHAYFREPTISILDGGDTIRFSDQGPGIPDKQLALEYGTSSATMEMKRYIRGVGSGLPYAQQYMSEKGGSLTIEDNISAGTVVTLSLHEVPQDPSLARGGQMGAEGPQAMGQAMTQGQPMGQAMAQPMGTSPWPQGTPQSPWGQPTTSVPMAPNTAMGNIQPMATTPWPGTMAPWPAATQGQAPWGYPQPPQSTPGSWQDPCQGWPTAANQSMDPMGQAPMDNPWAIPQPMAGAQVADQAMGTMPGSSLWAEAEIKLSDRESTVLDYLTQHEAVGPTELVHTHGASDATWSRCLSDLKARGLLKKVGQKHYLTDMGIAWVRSHPRP